MNVFVYPPAYGFGLGTLFEPVAAAMPARVGAWQLAAEVGAAPPGGFDLACLYSLPNTAASFRNLTAARRGGLRVVAMAVYADPTRYYTEGLAYAELPDAGSAADASDRRSEQALRRAALAVELALLRAIYRACDVVIAQSDGEAQALADDFQIARERIAVACVGSGKAYPSPDPEAFRRKYIAPRWSGREFALCVGRVDANKNQLALVRALKGVDIPLVLAGGSLAPGYLDACQRDADANVLFLPALSDAELGAAYAAARTHVLPSWLEVIGFVTLEAAVAGCNVVLTPAHGAREYVGERGWYCDPADLSSIRSAVLAAHHAPRQPELREHLVKTYSWENHVRAVYEAFERALALPPLADDAAARADLEQAGDALVTLLPLLEQARAELWQQKVNADKLVEQYANGRVMRALAAVTRLLKR